MSGENSDWQSLADEFAAWRAARLEPSFWWRDDDAGEPTPQFERLVALSRKFALPLALAAVPAWCREDLKRAIGSADVAVLQHGYAHRNHAAPGEKSSELGGERPAPVVVAELAVGRQRLEELFDDRFLPVMVPPWNRIAPYLPPLLAELRYIGLSQFGPRLRPHPVRGIVQVNAHVDIVYWKSKPPEFAGTMKLLNEVTRQLRLRRGGEADRAEPIGLLTHHAAHDESCWFFLEEFLGMGRRAGARWLGAHELFSTGAT
jgi:hypothetical protein